MKEGTRLYVITEGNDGAGKDTAADMLITRMEEAGLNPLRVAEPCEDLPHGQLLRKLLISGEHPESHAALFLADRMALQATQVVPALKAGRPVISVRSFLSTLTYQAGRWPLPWLLDIHRQMLAKPDVVIFLDVPPEEGLRRVGKRAAAKEVYERIDIQERNRARYLDLIVPEGEDHLAPLLAPGCIRIVVDATMPREEVHEAIWDQIQPKVCP
jgi:dTMP kinase